MGRELESSRTAPTTRDRSGGDRARAVVVPRRAAAALATHGPCRFDPPAARPKSSRADRPSDEAIQVIERSAERPARWRQTGAAVAILRRMMGLQVKSGSLIEGRNSIDRHDLHLAHAAGKPGSLVLTRDSVLRPLTGGTAPPEIEAIAFQRSIRRCHPNRRHRFGSERYVRGDQHWSVAKGSNKCGSD